MPRYAAAITLALSALTLSSQALADHAWGPYHWARTTAQFTLQMGNNLTAQDWIEYLNAAASDWNSPEQFGAAFTPVLSAVVAGKSKSNCSSVAGTTQVCNARYGANGWLGLATINIVDGVHITRGTAKMNDTYFSLATYNNPNEKRHVMCQEIAHTFGLAHQSEDGSSQNSCMDYFSNTGNNAGSTLSTRPNLHDFQQLDVIYSHLDSTSTVSTGGSGSTGGKGRGKNRADEVRAEDVDITSDPQSWGRLVRQSASGRSSEYERNNRDGSVTLTHVYWTLEAAERCPACDHRYEDHEH